MWKTFLGCDPNTKMPADGQHLLQENNGPQIRDVEHDLFPSDPIQASNDVERSMYWGSFGVMNSNSYSKGGGSFTKINGTTVSPGDDDAGAGELPERVQRLQAGFAQELGCGVPELDLLDE